MALINNMYIFVESESVSHSYGLTENKVEKGLPLTDHVEQKAIEFSIRGMLLNTDTQKASDQYAKLRSWANKGTVVKYVGRNILNVAITSISKDSDYKIENGASVSISMREIRVGQNSYKGSTSSQQVKGTNKKVTHTVRKGETLNYIAKKYGVTVANIKKLNNLKSNTIKIGAKLVIKK